jgi:hypothetical protein
MYMSWENWRVTIKTLQDISDRYGSELLVILNLAFSGLCRSVKQSPNGMFKQKIIGSWQIVTAVMKQAICRNPHNSSNWELCISRESGYRHTCQNLVSTKKKKKKFLLPIFSSNMMCLNTGLFRICQAISVSCKICASGRLRQIAVSWAIYLLVIINTPHRLIIYIYIFTRVCVTLYIENCYNNLRIIVLQVNNRIHVENITKNLTNPPAASLHRHTSHIYILIQYTDSGCRIFTQYTHFELQKFWKDTW